MVKIYCEDCKKDITKIRKIPVDGYYICYACNDERKIKKAAGNYKFEYPDTLVFETGVSRMGEHRLIYITKDLRPACDLTAKYLCTLRRIGVK